MVIPSPKLIAGVVGLGLVVALFFGVKSYLDGVDAKAYERGRKEVEAAFVQRDNEALRAANDKIRELVEKAQARERALAAKTAEVDRRLQKEIEDARLQRERDIAAVRAGFRLRDPGCERAASAAGSGGSSQGGATGAPGISDAREKCRLSEEATGFLLQFSDEADSVAEQLKAAQDLIRTYHDGRNQEVPGTP